jgi:hypothetical protein
MKLSQYLVRNPNPHALLMLPRFVTVVDVQLSAPSLTCKLNLLAICGNSDQQFDWKLGIKTTQDSGYRHLHGDVSEHPLELRLRTKFTNRPRKGPGMELVVAFAKLVISKEEIPIADRTLSPSVCMFSHKRLIAKIEAIMMIRGN